MWQNIAGTSSCTTLRAETFLTILLQSAKSFLLTCFKSDKKGTALGQPRCWWGNSVGWAEHPRNWKWRPTGTCGHWRYQDINPACPMSWCPGWRRSVLENTRPRTTNLRIKHQFFNGLQQFFHPGGRGCCKGVEEGGNPSWGPGSVVTRDAHRKYCCRGFTAGRASWSMNCSDGYHRGAQQ